MVQRYEFPQETQIGNVGDPTQPQDASTKAYVDSRPSGSISLEVPGVYTNAVVAQGNVVLATSIASGTYTTINLTAGVGSGTSMATLFNGLPLSQIFKFVGAVATFQEASVSLVNADTVQLNLNSAVTFTALNSGAQLLLQSSAQTLSPFTRVISGANTTLTVAADQDNVQALTIAAAAGGSIIYEVPELWQNTVVAQGTVGLAAATNAGTYSSLAVTAGPGSATNVANFVTGRGVGQIWRFGATGNSIAISTAVVSGDNVILNFPGATNFPVGLNQGTVLEYFVSAQTLEPFTRVIAGTGLAGVVAPDVNLAQALTLTATGGGGTPGGQTTQVQFNNNGAFGGSAGLTWSGTQLGTNIVSADASSSLSLRGATGIRIQDQQANFLGLNGSLAGSTPSIAAQGTDANVNLAIYGKGTGGIQVGTLANATPLIVADAAVQTALTPGTVGQVLTSAGAAKTPYWGAGGSGGSTTLQALTDVSIVEPVFVQVGTITVVSISALITSITVSSATGIAVGDWLRGGTVLPGQVPALQVISIVGTLIEFNLDPTPFFAVGNFVYRLPENLEGARLSFSNAQNKWISSASLNFLPMDTISWVSLAGDPYVSVSGSPIVVAPITTNVLDLVNPWTFGIATLGNFPSPSEVCGVDALGRQVTGQYTSAAQAGTPTAVLEAIKFDRVSGGSFVINNTYPLTWRAGTFALPDYVRFNTTSNAITQGQTAVDLRTATLIGSVPNTFTNQNVLSVSTGFTGSGTIWQSVSTVAGYNAAVAAMLTTGATQPVGAGNWTLPSYSIFISNLASPSATQIGTITTITQNAAANLLSITFGGGNAPYFSTQTGSAQTLFTQTNKFTFVAAPQTEVIRLATANAITSVNSIPGGGGVSLIGGTSIGVATDVPGRTATINFTGTGAVVSSNFTSFVTQSGAFVSYVTSGFVSNTGIIGLGFQSDAEGNDGGFLGTTKYIGTTQTDTPPWPRGMLFPVSTTYTDLEVQIDFPAFTFTFTTSSASSPGNFMLDNLLFSKRLSTAVSPPNLNTNLFPGFALSSPGSDDQQLLPTIAPILTVIGSGTSWSATVTASKFNGVANNYLHTDTTNDYVAFFRLIVSSPNNISSISTPTQTGGAGGIRALVAIAASGTSSTLQGTLNIGNSATNTPAGNVSTILLTDSVSAKTTTLDGTKVKAQSLVLDGSTSGSLTVKAAAATTSYPLTFPALQATTAGQVLSNDSTGILSWVTPSTASTTRQIAAISTANITPSGAQTVDGYMAATGDYILLASGQTDATTQGLYIANIAGAWAKQTTIVFQSVFSLNGTANGLKQYSRTTASSNEVWILTAITAGGGASNLQSVVNLGNSITNSGTNVGAILITDSVSAKTTTLDGTQVKSQSLVLDGSTSGSLTITTSPATSSYPLIFPALQGGSGRGLVNSGTGTLSWEFVLGSRQIRAISLVNVLPSDSQVVDGISPVTNDSVLLVNQTDATQNGYWRVNTLTAWTKQTSFIFQSLFATSGNTNAGKTYSRAVDGAVPGVELWSLTAINTASGGTPNWQSVMTQGNFINASAAGLTPLVLRDNQATPRQITLQTPAAITANYSLTLPLAQATAANQTLLNDGAGILSWGTSAIPGGLTTQFQYNNAGAFAGTAGLTFDATNGRASALAPVVAANVARLTDVQAATAGLRPQNTSGILVHIAETNVTGTYTNNGGVSVDTFIGATQLIIAGVAPLTNSQVVMVAQTAGLQNGSYRVLGNTVAGGFSMIRTAIVPTFGNFWIATNTTSTNYGVQYENVTVAPITVGTTAIVYALFGVANPAAGVTPTLQQVTTAGSVTTTGMGIGGNLEVGYRDPATTLVNAILFTPSLNGTPTISTTGLSTNIPLRLFTQGTAPILCDDEVRIGAFATPTDYLSISVGAVSRSLSGNLSVLAGNNPANQLILGNAAATTVNRVAISSGTATAGPTISPTGSTNSSITLSGAGTGSVFLATNFAEAIQITGSNSTATPPVIAAVGSGPTSLQLLAEETGSIIMSNGGANSVSVTGGVTGSAATIAALGDANASLNIAAAGTGVVNLGTNQPNNIRITPAATGSTPRISAVGEANANLIVQASGTGVISLANGGVNSIRIAGAATGVAPSIAASGDANLDLNIAGAGTGAINLGTNFVNRIRATGAATGFSSQISVVGDTNATLTISAAGTGAINLGNGAVNFLRITGAAGGANPPIIEAAGGNDIPIAIRPAGPGHVFIGNTDTYTGLQVGGGQTTFTNLQAIGIGADISVVLAPKGAGDIYLIGAALSATVANQPSIFVASSVGATTLGTGTAGQVLTSPGPAGSGSPYWGSNTRPATDVGFSAGGLGLNANFAIGGGVETVINWSTGTANPPTGWTYSAGVFTNNTGLTKVVAISASVQVTGGVSNLFEQDLWIAQNPNNRLAQAVNTTSYTSGNVPPLQVSTIATVANNGTLRVFFWASTSVALSALGNGYGFGGCRCNFAVIS